MRIGIDIDDTITNSKEFIYELKKKKFPELDPRELLPKKIYDAFMIEIDDDIHKYVPLKKGVVNALTRLKKRGHEIIFITARGSISPHSIQDTITYFKEKEIPYDEIIFHATHKSEVAKNKGIDLYIDDREALLEEVSSLGIDCIKMKRDHEKSVFPEFTQWKQIIDYIESEYANGTNNYK